MAGTCINVIKLIGLGSLGLLTTQLNYEFFNIIPNVINNITNNISTTTTTTTNNNYNSNSSTNKSLFTIKNQIINSRIVQGILNLISTASFITAYNYSSVTEKHPYLIYASIPASLIYLIYHNYQIEEKLLQKSAKSNTTTNTTNDIKPIKSKTQKLSDSVDDFVHLSESGDTTPELTNSESEDQPTTTNKTKEELEIDQEIENTLLQKEINIDLKKIENGYKVGSIISGASFLIATIGLIGDFYLL
ncbi:unnamed protein product [Candida verbasci]|uniref:Autophagy-related protein 33 n=1 Tax=Candida verbasci TaxID=1227364 RepID=A0A9W4TXI6_9ASCO|nr:unnamed protein product [Candida verbasci]